MFQNKYQEMNEKILPNEDLHRRIMEKTEATRPVRRKFAAVAAVLALVLLARPVMAA